MFREAARSSGITHASGELHLYQSTISLHMKRPKEDLRLRFFCAPGGAII